MKVSPFKRSCMAFSLSACMLLSLLPVSASAVSSAAIKEELNTLKEQNATIQAEIDQIQSQYDATSNEIQALVDRKNAVDQEISLLHNQITNITQQINAFGQLIADAQDQLDDAEQTLTELNQKHKERIQAMEEAGNITYWQVIFQANSFTDLLDRMNMIDEIAAADQRRLDEIQSAADLVSATRQQMQEEKSSLDEMQLQLLDSQAALEEKRTESDELLRSLSKQQDEFQLLLDYSEARQDALMKEIAQKQKELSNAEYQEKLAKIALQGSNPPSDATWLTPVSGYTITSAFGMRVHPVYGYQLMHNGVDLACPQGTPIYATRAGTVTTASYQEGGAGYYVSINHGDGFGSIYMHMTHYVVSAGQSVSAGQLIGYVGSTGVSTGPHLHFGISYAGTYVNPLAYI